MTDRIVRRQSGLLVPHSGDEDLAQARREAEASRQTLRDLAATAARSRRSLLERVGAAPASAKAKPKWTAKRRAKAKAARRARKRQRR